MLIVYLYIIIPICVCVRARVCLSVSARLCLCVCLSVCLCLCMYVCLSALSDCGFTACPRWRCVSVCLSVCLAVHVLSDRRHRLSALKIPVCLR